MRTSGMTLNCIKDWVLKDCFVRDEDREVAKKNWLLNETNKYALRSSLYSLVTERIIDNETEYLNEDQALDTYLMEHLNFLAMKKALWAHPMNEADEENCR